MPNYKMMKVFDCQKMPETIQKAFFSHCRGQYSNDCYCKWYMYMEIDPKDHQRLLIHNWLIANGAEYGERVIIKYWW